MRLSKFGLIKDKSKGKKNRPGTNMKDLDKMLTDFCENAFKEAKILLSNANQNLFISVQNYIYQQLGASQWADLNEDYLAWKDRNGLDTRTLIATGGYVQSISPLPVRDRLGRFTSFSKMTPSQIPDLRLGATPGFGRSKQSDDGSPDSDSPTYRQIGLWLEYGTSTMPARPHFGPAIFNFRTKELPALNARLAELMKKGTGKKPRSTRMPRTKVPVDKPAKPDRSARPDKPHKLPSRDNEDV